MCNSIYMYGRAAFIYFYSLSPKYMLLYEVSVFFLSKDYNGRLRITEVIYFIRST